MVFARRDAEFRHDIDASLLFQEVGNLVILPALLVGAISLRRCIRVSTDGFKETIHANYVFEGNLPVGMCVVVSFGE